MLEKKSLWLRYENDSLIITSSIHSDNACRRSLPFFSFQNIRWNVKLEFVRRVIKNLIILHFNEGYKNVTAGLLKCETKCFFRFFFSSSCEHGRVGGLETIDGGIVLRAERDGGGEKGRGFHARVFRIFLYVGYCRVGKMPVITFAHRDACSRYCLLAALFRVIAIIFRAAKETVKSL